MNVLIIDDSPAIARAVENSLRNRIQSVFSWNHNWGTILGLWCVSSFYSHRRINAWPRWVPIFLSDKKWSDSGIKLVLLELNRIRSILRNSMKESFSRSFEALYERRVTLDFGRSEWKRLEYDRWAKLSGNDYPVYVHICFRGAK